MMGFRGFVYTVARSARAASDRLDDSFLGAAIGSVALFGLLIGGLFLGFGGGLQ